MVHADECLSEPLVRELTPPPEPELAFERLGGGEHCLWLDSALRHPQLGRYSFLSVDPVEFHASGAGDADPLASLERLWATYRTRTAPGVPPFQGGVAALLSYELGRTLEKVPAALRNEFDMPLLAFGVYDVVLAWDHAQRRAWIISQGYPERDEVRRRTRAAERIDEFLARLAGASRDDARDSNSSAPAERLAAAPRRASLRPPLAPTELTRQHGDLGLGLPRDLTSNFSGDGYRAMVERAVEYIRAGDIFQVNLSQRLLYPACDDARALYRRLRRRNPATFAAYFDLGEFQIASASPERFMQVTAGHVETRPIKGTRRRMASAEADLFLGDVLKESEKDRAENVMIVDLLRNDLARVCRPESVRVTQLCGLETYEYVQHLVSVVCGELTPGRTPLDLIRASFPGGSITGAPKIRAMEIIAELEPTVRGPYCGSLGYLGFDGTLDLNILIRTITSGRGWRQFPVGGGIVAQSRPQAEYEETWHKAAGMIQSLG